MTTLHTSLRPIIRPYWPGRLPQEYMGDVAEVLSGLFDTDGRKVVQAMAENSWGDGQRLAAILGR